MGKAEKTMVGRREGFCAVSGLWLGWGGLDDGLARRT